MDTQYDAQELVAEIVRRGELEELIEEVVKRGRLMELISALEDQGTQVSTPREYFRDQILVTLSELGGKESTENVISRIEQKRRPQFTKHDGETLDNGRVRWIDNAYWARNKLREEGLIAGSTPRCIWELTDKGKVEAEIIKEG